MTAQVLTHKAFEDPDAGLVRQAAGGNMQAFQSLFERHHRKVYGLVWRLAGDNETAHDLTQEVFIKLWDALASFRGESKFSTWLHTVATRVAISELRKQKRWRQDVSLTDVHDYADAVVQQESADLSELDKLIKRLPEQMRWVFVLHCIEGLRHDEVAEELGIAVGTSKAQVHRARTLLEEWLSDE